MLYAARFSENSVMRLYGKASSASQSPHHQASHGSIYERFSSRPENTIERRGMTENTTELKLCIVAGGTDSPCAPSRRPWRCRTSCPKAPMSAPSTRRRSRSSTSQTSSASAWSSCKATSTRGPPPPCRRAPGGGPGASGGRFPNAPGARREGARRLARGRAEGHAGVISTSWQHRTEAIIGPSPFCRERRRGKK